MSSGCAERPGWSVLAACLLVLAGCGGEQTTPEDGVRATIAAMEKAVEESAIRQAAELLHPDYRDSRHPNKRAAVHSLLAYMRRHRDVHLFSVIKSLELSAANDSARAVVYVAMTGTPVQSLDTAMALKADLLRFEVEFARVDEDWRIVHSDWRRADSFVL